MQIKRKGAKKGFSLLEMLIVIAIIAALVAIVTPVATAELTKSAAAANAANLRTTVAQLANKRAMNEDDFEAAYQANRKQANTIIIDLTSPLLEWLGWKNYSNWATERLYDCVANAEGNLYWRNANRVFLTGVPAAKRMVVKDSNGSELIIPKNAPMHVFISDDAIVATYRTANGSEFGVEDFADVAEDGKYDGGVTVSDGNGSGWGDKVEDWWDELTCRNHYNDPEAGCWCQSCNTQDHVSDPKTTHVCECGTTISTCESSSKTNVDATNHKCSVCGTLYPHTWNALGYCSAGCGAQKKVCGWNGCQNDPANILGGNVSTYCASHLFQHNCSHCGTYRDSSMYHSDETKSCPNIKNHPNCQYGSCEGDYYNGTLYCSSHQPHTCGANLDKNGNKKCSETVYGNEPCKKQDDHYDPGCVTPDTMVTLANGTQKRIDEVTYSDYLLVWDFYKGDYAVVPAAIIFDHGYDNNTVIALNFSDGTTVKVVNMHQFYDTDLNTLATINAENVAEYVGHGFAKQGNQTVELVSYSITEEYVEAFGIISAVHYNIFVEGMLSADFMPEDYDLFTYFEFGSDMKYDQAQMEADIAEYGLYTYEEFADYLTYEQFVGFNVPYMKIAVGKGNYTYEGILDLIEFYLASEA